MKRQILFINDNLDTGGVERVLQSIVASLADADTEISIWASHGDRASFKRAYPAASSFRKYPFWDLVCTKRFTPRWFYSRSLRVLFEHFLLRLKKWDVIIAMKEGPSMSFASHLRAKKKIAWVHTDYDHFYWTRFVFPLAEKELECMRRFDHVVCVSEAARQSVINTLGDPGCLCTLYNPIDYRAIEAAAEAVPADCVHPVGKPLLVSVGRLSLVKRYDMLIDICAELSGKHDFELWIIGGGEMEEELRAMLEEKNISCVKLLGARDNPHPYTKCADWMLSSSETESYGLAIQESLILGTPVLASYCPAIAETLDSKYGIIAGTDRQALFDELDRILSHPELGEGLRDNLREFDKSSLWEARMRDIRALIDE